MHIATTHGITTATAECDDSSKLVLRGWWIPVTLSPQLTFCHWPQVPLPPKEDKISYT
jgi:hypothetical protein